MRKVAFYLFNKNNAGIDLTNITEGNPGIGGSEFLTALVAYHLSTRENGIDLILYTSDKAKLPEGVRCRVAGSMRNALQDALATGIEVFVADIKRFDDKDLTRKFGEMKIVYWCHNFQSGKALKKMMRSPSLGRIVTVGREQMDLYRDGKAFNCSDYIYNCVSIPKEYVDAAQKFPYEKRTPSVAYLGSLVPDKGFHVLAELWPAILQQVPAAQLYVIGSAKVYDGNVLLGKYGISTQEYEELFMPYLTDKEGHMLPSVHFLGTLGNKKYEVLMKVKVGCPNPTGNSETFCLSAVEMQAMGCAVTAMQAPGYLDTFYNGHTARNKKELLLRIVTLLRGAPLKTFSDTQKFIDDHFSPHVVMSDWERLLKSDMQMPLQPIFPLSHAGYRFKRLKEGIRKLKRVFPILYKLPNIDSSISYVQSRIFRKR